MTYETAVREFQEIYRDLYIRRVDYWTAQLCWADYVDNLHREGEITDLQNSRWPTPFTYGKPLRPKMWQLEMEVNMK